LIEYEEAFATAVQETEIDVALPVVAVTVGVEGVVSVAFVKVKIRFALSAEL
jgi:hypothetical protein